MALAISPLPTLFAPLQAFAAWLAGERPAAPSLQPAAQPFVPLARPRIARPLPAKRPAPPLRVVRVVEPGSRTPGRIVISGRMADVCAELDRLAEHEASALQVRPPTR